MSKTTVQTQQLTPFGAALAGALGACFSNAYVLCLFYFHLSLLILGFYSVVYPLDVYVTRMDYVAYL
jgi:hypothetical protein